MRPRKKTPQTPLKNFYATLEKNPRAMRGFFYLLTASGLIVKGNEESPSVPYADVGAFDGGRRGLLLLDGGFYALEDFLFLLHMKRLDEDLVHVVNEHGFDLLEYLGRYFFQVLLVLPWD